MTSGATSPLLNDRVGETFNVSPFGGNPRFLCRLHPSVECGFEGCYPRLFALPDLELVFSRQNLLAGQDGGIRRRSNRQRLDSGASHELAEALRRAKHAAGHLGMFDYGENHALHGDDLSLPALAPF